MEPVDPNSSAAPDDLDRLLRSGSPLAPLRDDGFSASVLATLPPPPPAYAARRRRWCAAGALVGVLVACAGLVSGDGFAGSLPALDHALVALVEQLTSPAGNIALGATLGSLLVAFWPRVRRMVSL